MENRVIVKCLVKDGVHLPEYKTPGAAGADLCAKIDAPVIIEAGGRAVIPTGLCVEIPVGYEIQMRARSGLAAKNGITVFNSPGTIDSDYRGELCVILFNSSRENFTVNDGDRIAQLVLAPVTIAKFEKAETLSDTQRGQGGLGSTGVSFVAQNRVGDGA